MQERKPEQPKKIPASQLAASKRFGQYKKENEHEIRSAQVEENETLEKLSGVWNKYRKLLYHRDPNQILSSLIEGISYSASDIERFSIILGKFQHEDGFSYGAAAFLNFLIYHGHDDHYIIQTSHLESRMDFLGTNNPGKIITVVGDVGTHCGSSMRSGLIHVKGNTREETGRSMLGGKIIIDGDAYDCGDYMDGGEILVKGNVIHNVGHLMGNGKIYIDGDVLAFMGEAMAGGEIHVAGNAGSYINAEIGTKMNSGLITIDGDVRGWIGDKMNGGVIYIGGNIEDFSKVKGQSVYHKGKLIVDK